MRTLEVCLLVGLLSAAQVQASGEMGQIWLGAHAPYIRVDGVFPEGVLVP